MKHDSVIDILWQAGPVVKLVLLVLVSLSVFSWAIIIFKWKYFSKANKQSDEFYRIFRTGQEPTYILKYTKHLTLSPLANLFRSLCMDKQIGKGGTEGLIRVINRYVIQETTKFERYLSFLATTGSTAPFIGLFGTVWGIMDSFRGIGAKGSASLAVVAPGIAEALIATAVGLLAAIPAVIGYNYYVSITRRMSIEIEDFAQDLHHYLDRVMDENSKR
ncbi:MAG: MotA/TolQ/ExbB proton channel family protein [Candidatus Magnetoovum sp. WYHC-5]|nr:MotA/TolQ/ExbB proton channel family protein [Candidatus Magnetoovum sp. WYHC-5]